MFFLLCIKIQWCQLHVSSDRFPIEHLGIILGTDIFKSFFSLVSLIFSSCCWDFFKTSWWQGCREKPVLMSQVMALCDCQLYVLSGLCQEYAGEFIGMLERYSWRHLIVFSLLLISWFRNQCCWGLLNSSRFYSKALCSLRSSAVATLLTVTNVLFLFTIPWMDEKITCFPATMAVSVSFWPDILYFNNKAIWKS